MIWEWLKDKKISPKILKLRQEGDITIVYGENLEICYLNKIGGIILAASNGSRTVQDIAQQLLSRFQVDEEELHVDLIDIIRDLQWKRLITLEG